jgi:thiol-disulfide isomerase/thioredoxin
MASAGPPLKRLPQSGFAAAAGWLPLRRERDLRVVKIVTLALAVMAVVVAAVVVFGGLSFRGPADSPPLAGTLADFSPFDPPRPAPDAAFADGQGHAVRLADFGGRVVLLNLWATWCAPCLEELPSLDRLQAALGGAAFEVVALSIDRDGAVAAAAFQRRLGLRHLGLYLDPENAIGRALGAQGLPTTYLIGRDGQVMGAKLGNAAWDSPEAKALIEHYLKSKNP